jgi:LmbE family N-acetylglucosaminyl deacetylase
MKYLIIAAHPDDEVLGCGGTMARLSLEGHEVHIVILGEGITSRSQAREQANHEQLAALHNCSRRVADYLGAHGLELTGLPDNRFDSMDILDVVKIIENIVEKLKPDYVFTQHGGDLNIDHVVTFRATLTATRPMMGRTVKAVYGYQVASSTEWAFAQFSPRFTPQYFVDIEKTLEQKIHAMQLYESEARPFPHPRAPEALRAQAYHLGSQAGLKAAEAFSVIWQIH